MSNSLSAFAFTSLPLVRPGDGIAKMILDASLREGMPLQSGDVIVIAQKVISKSQGRLLDLATVATSPEALSIGKTVDKDPRLVQAIIDESTEIVRTAPGLVIAAHRCGAVLANAGIDRSNVEGSEDIVLLLPDDPDGVCREIRAELRGQLGFDVAVIIGDSLGRPWRMGTTGTAIGASGVPSLLDLRGRKDLFGRTLMVSEEAIADELAATASLLQGQGREGRPVVVIRGDFDWQGLDYPASVLVRPKEQDLFR